MSIKVAIVPVTAGQQNCGIILGATTGRSAIVDPGGNQAELISSIRDKLFPLGDDITFIPGHGPASTLGL